MIPMVATLKLRNHRLRGFSIWIPLFLIWVILLPVVLILSPFFLIACLITLINPLRAIGVFWEILCGLRGTHIEVLGSHQQLIQISIR